MAKFRMWLDTKDIHSRVWGEFEVADEELEDMDEGERESFLADEVQARLNQLGNWGWEPLDDAG